MRMQAVKDSARATEAVVQEVANILLRIVRSSTKELDRRDSERLAWNRPVHLMAGAPAARWG